MSIRRRLPRLAPTGAAAVALLCGCNDKPGRDDPGPLPGGGPHEITDLSLSASPSRAKVGEAVILRAEAVWAIPSVEDASARASYEVVEEEMGEVVQPKDAGARDEGWEGRGVFIPEKPGRATIRATYSGSTAEAVVTVEE